MNTNTATKSFRKGQFVTTTTTVNAYGDVVMPSDTVYVITYAGSKSPGKLRVFARDLMYTREIPIDSCTLATPPKPNVKVGDVFVCSWGYDQTNIDFYMVIKLTDKTARLAKLPARTTHRDGAMSGYTMPVLPNPSTLGEGEQYKINLTLDNRVFFRLTSYSSAHPWDGKECFFSEWA
jgi:hypothetical protein